MLSSIIKGQRAIGKYFDSFLPDRFTMDGNADFAKDFVPSHLSTNQIVFDIGVSDKLRAS